MNQEYLKGIHSEMCSREAIIFRLRKITLSVS